MKIQAIVNAIRAGDRLRTLLLPALSLGIALWAQTRLPAHALQGGLAYGAAAAIFILTLARSGNHESAGFTAPAGPGRPSVVDVAVLSSAIPPGIAALILFDIGKTPNVVIALWASSVLLALYGAWRLDRTEPSGSPAPSWTRQEIAVLLAIVAVAAFLRVWRIWQFPGVYEDEANHLADAYRVMDGVITTPFVSATWSTGTIFHYPLAGLLALRVDPVVAIKLMGIVPGVLSCVFVYLFLRELLGRVAAPIGAALLATSSWHILVSRWGYEYALDGLLVVITLYFMVRGLRTRHRFDFALAGTALGLGLVLTKSAATAPLLIMGVGLFFLWRYGAQAARMFGQHFFLLALLALLVFAPRGLYIAKQPNVALSRPREDFLFNNSAWADRKQDPLNQTVRNMRELLLTFNYRSGYEPRWNVRPLKPTLDEVTGALLVLGFAYALLRVREWRYFLLLMTVVAFVVPASTTLALDDRPVAYRIFGVIPALYAFAALPLWLLWRSQRDPPGKVAVALATVVLLGGSAYLNYTAYFGQYGTSVDTYYATGQVETRVARRVEALAGDYDVYLTTGEVFTPTVEDITRGRATYRAIESIDDVATVGFEGRPLAFVVVKENKWSTGTFGEALLSELTAVYPQGRAVEGDRDPTGKVIYVTYFVDAPPG
jgi:hypothetical protein